MLDQLHFGVSYPLLFANLKYGYSISISAFSVESETSLYLHGMVLLTVNYPQPHQCWLSHRDQGNWTWRQTQGFLCHTCFVMLRCNNWKSSCILMLETDPSILLPVKLKWKKKLDCQNNRSIMFPRQKKEKRTVSCYNVKVHVTFTFFQDKIFSRCNVIRTTLALGSLQWTTISSSSCLGWNMARFCCYVALVNNTLF